MLCITEKPISEMEPTEVIVSVMEGLNSIYTATKETYDNLKNPFGEDKEKGFALAMVNSQLSFILGLLGEGNVELMMKFAKMTNDFVIEYQNELKNKGEL